MQCKEWDDANSELFKESHDEAVHKISYESRLYELISASLAHRLTKESQSAGRLPFGSQFSIEYHSDLWPRTPFAATQRSPQGETRRYGISL